MYNLSQYDIRRIKLAIENFKDKESDYICWFLQAFLGVIVSKEEINGNRKFLEKIVMIKKLENIFSEAHLNIIMRGIRDENAEQKIKIIKNELCVTVIEEEASKGENLLRDIIESRLLRICPKCKDDFAKKCDLCDGEKFVDGVQEEKYLLENVKNNN